jgi:hypothetical protein
MLEVMQAEDLESLFLLPLSQQAFEELENLLAKLQDLSYDVDAADRWTPSGVTITLQGDSILKYSRTWRFILFSKSSGNLDVLHVSSSSPGRFLWIVSTPRICCRRETFMFKMTQSVLCVIAGKRKL